MSDDAVAVSRVGRASIKIRHFRRKGDCYSYVCRLHLELILGIILGGWVIFFAALYLGLSRGEAVSRKIAVFFLLFCCGTVLLAILFLIILLFVSPRMVLDTEKRMVLFGRGVRMKWEQCIPFENIETVAMISRGGNAAGGLCSYVAKLRYMNPAKGQRDFPLGHLRLANARALTREVGQIIGRTVQFRQEKVLHLRFWTP